MDKYQNKLKTPSGFRDLLPSEAMGREYLVECIGRVYKRYGFLPLETPVAEFENILVSESVSDFNLFRLEPTTKRVSENDKEEIALRFDLTVPLARVVSQYGNALPRPFKRYQAGYVFRGERPQKGRFRQFMQFDADIVGTKSILADTEMIAMISDIMKEVGVSEYVVRANTRTLLNCLPKFIACPENMLREILVVLDKREKISDEVFEEELYRLRINEDGIKKLKEFSNIAGEPREVIQKLKEFFKDFLDAEEGIQELQNLAGNLQALGLSGKVQFDMKIIRGFSYYTGIVFETNLLKGLEFGSVISGGRYDNLVERFTGQSIASVGVSVGVDRFETALCSIFGGVRTTSRNIRIVVFCQSSIPYALSVTTELRKRNQIDLYVGAKTDFKEILKYAESIGAEYIAIVGTEEEKSNTVSIKNIYTRKQKTIPFDTIDSLSIDF